MASRCQERKRVYCPHCGEYVSRSLFYNHKQLYYDEILQKWNARSSASSAAAQQPIAVTFEFTPESRNYREEEHFPELRGQDVSDGDLDFDSDGIDDHSDIEDNNSIDCAEEIELDFEILSDADLQNKAQENEHYCKVIRVFLLFLFLWQSLFRISDGAISLMLSFMAKFFSLAGSCLKIEVLKDIAAIFPRTLHLAKGSLALLHDKFKKYVTCKKCHSLYLYEESKDVDSCGKKVSQLCSYVRYPTHIQARMRLPCGEKLLKVVRSSNGTEYLVPFQTYCFASIPNCMEELLNRPSMVQDCEKWRKREISSGALTDVYDGQMWEYFQFDSDGKPFLAEPNNYLLMLNCDWFQPFRHTPFSVGVLYVVVENLPREVRFRRENILVIGIIPGPSEPSMNINSYLEPVVKDLKNLWEGVLLDINGKQTKIRAAVACLACDVPAARKVGGFIGFKAKYGCTKCLKEFRVDKFGDYPDYSGFSKLDWEPRSHALHIWHGIKHRNAKTEAEKKSIEASYGARYSSLFELQYYRPVSSCIIDPMHCLFLGIAKHFFKVWISKDLLQNDQLQSIQKKVDQFNCPPDIGRIPYKLASKFSGLKSDQWKSWTMYFSLFALKGTIPHRDYDCWLMFVKVCTRICKREIQLSELEIIDCEIQNFCEKFEQLYGKSFLTPNMHLAAHITDCIRDHGPVYAFWLYGFERMNGILGSFQTSNHDITVQLMRRVLSMQNTSLHKWPADIRSELSPLFEDSFKESGSLLETLGTSEIKPLPPLTEKAFAEHEMEMVQELVNSLHPVFTLLRLYRSTQAVTFGGSIKLATKRSRYSNASKVVIQNSLFEINQFVYCSVLVSDPITETSSTYRYWLAQCSPYMDHPCKPWFGYPTQVWSSVCNGCKYFFVSQIESRVVYAHTTVDFGRVIGKDKVLIITPIPFHS